MANEYFLATGITLVAGVIFYGLGLISEISKIAGIVTAILLLIMGSVFLSIYFF